MMTRFLLVLFSTYLLMTPDSLSKLHAEDWPGFRGLDLAGTRSDATLPAEAVKSNTTQWSYALGTTDVGSMAVQDDRVYLLSTASDRQSIRLICLDLVSGKELWKRAFANADNHLHSRNTLASSTPATDDKYVFVAHSDREHTYLRCLTLEGEEVWMRDFGTAQSQHGFGTSPVVTGDTVLLNFSQQAERVRQGTPGTSRMIAVDRSTGKTRWETGLTSTRVCYGTPLVRDGLVFGANTGDGVFALSLETGEKLWSLPVFGLRCVSSPVMAEGLVIGSAGSGGGGNHLVAVRAPEIGGTPEEAFRIDRYAPYVPTGVTVDGNLFVVDDKGIASCFSLENGKPFWTKRLGGNYGASPIRIGDQIVVISLQGDLTAFEATAKYKESLSVDLGGSVGATPAFAGGRLLVRVGAELRCY